MRHHSSRPGIPRGSAAMALLPLLAGCASLRGAPEHVVDVDREVAALAPLHGDAFVATCVQTAEEAERRRCRDQIIEARMIAIDRRYTEFRQDFYADSRWGRFAATIASLGLTAAGTLSGADAGKVIAAAATGLTGARAAFDREILVEKTAAAIETAMDSARDKVALRIREGMRQPTTTYSLSAAIGDLEAYYNAGSLLGALSDITRLVGVQSAEVQADLRAAVREANFGHTASGDRIRAFVRPNGVRDPKRWAEVDAWTQARFATPLQMLISSDGTDPRVEARRQAVITRFDIP